MRSLISRSQKRVPFKIGYTWFFLNRPKPYNMWEGSFFLNVFCDKYKKCYCFIHINYLHSTCYTHSFPFSPQKYFVHLTGVRREGASDWLVFCTSVFSPYAGVSLGPTNQQAADTNVSISWLVVWVQTNLSFGVFVVVIGFLPFDYHVDSHFHI